MRGGGGDEPVLDLHGVRVADAIRRTTVFVVAEQQRGTAVVRIITGHGTGAVKHAVRELLTSHPAVAYLRPSLSSDAAMLVVLKPPSAQRS